MPLLQRRRAPDARACYGRDSANRFGKTSKGGGHRNSGERGGCTNLESVVRGALAVLAGVDDPLYLA